MLRLCTKFSVTQGEVVWAGSGGLLCFHYYCQQRQNPKLLNVDCVYLQSSGWSQLLHFGLNASTGCSWKTDSRERRPFGNLRHSSWRMFKSVQQAITVYFFGTFLFRFSEPHLISFTQRRLGVSTKSQKRSGRSISVHLLPHSSTGRCAAVFWRGHRHFHTLSVHCPFSLLPVSTLSASTHCHYIYFAAHPAAFPVFLLCKLVDFSLPPLPTCM